MPEQTTTSRRARRGYLIIAASVLMALVVFNADAVMDLARPDLELVALIPRAEGVRVGTAVWVAGVESGRVTAVGFVGRRSGRPGDADTSYVAVDVRLDPEARRVITRASDVRASRVRFIAEPIVQIDPGQAGDPPIREGDTLHGRIRPDPFELLDRATDLPASLDSLTRSVRSIQALADARGPEIRLLVRQLAATTEAATELSSAFQGGSLGPMLDPRRGLPARLAGLQARLDQLRAAADQVSRRYGFARDTASGTSDTAGLAGVMGDLLRRVEHVDRELARLQTRLARGEGFIPRVQQDSALQVAVRGVQAQIDSLTAEAASIGLRMLLP